MAGETATFVVNRNINFTNVCVVGCAFCGFGQGKRSPDAYLVAEDDFAARVRREAGALPAAQVERVYRIALGRRPSAGEIELGTEALERFAAAWARSGVARGAPAGGDAEARALASYCHTIMNSAEFLYLD